MTLYLNHKNSKIQKIDNTTRLTNNNIESALVFDNGSLPIVLDKNYCLEPQVINNLPDGVLSYNNIPVKGLMRGTNSIPILTTKDIGQFNTLCVNNFEEKFGVPGIIGIARGGDQVCLSGDSNCSPDLYWSNFSFMHQAEKTRFTYTAPEKSTEPEIRNKSMIPLASNRKFHVLRTAGKPYLDNPNNGQLIYSSLRRSSPEKNYPFMIFDLGWPPELTEKMGGQACESGVSFVGLGDLAMLEVDYENNKLSYQTKNGVDLEDRCK